MKNLPVAHRRNHNATSVFRSRCPRFGSAFLILAILGQVLFTGPVRSAKASDKVSVSPAGSLPLERSNISELSPSITEVPALAAPVLSGMVRTAEGGPTMPVEFPHMQPASFLGRLSSGTLSVFAFLASNVRAKTARPLPPPTPAASPVPGVVKFDFDGDGRADIGRWRGTGTDFTVRKSTDATNATYDLGSSLAISASVAAPGDFDGDGTTDAAVFGGGIWTYRSSASPSETPQTISLGSGGDIPVAGDYDGDGITDAAVYTPGSSATWKYKSGANPSGTPVTLTCVTTCGITGDVPVGGNYDGDGDSDIAVFRPSNGNWYISYTGGGGTTYHWGQTGDIPLQADFDGDGKSDPAVYRPSNGYWYWALSSTSYATYSYQGWGNYADQPVPGNYLGDARTDFAVWRPTTGVWHILENPGSFSTEEPLYDTAALGAIGDEAVESAYIKQIGSSVTGDVLGPLRLKAANATGGTNLNSQNFGWSTSLVNLPGRAGLDLNLGIGYNSLVWIKNGSAMYFDPDVSNVTPGFRLGFPVIEPAYYDSVKAKWTYMMVTSTGAHVEFRQQGAGDTYDTYDSSYTQLVTNTEADPNSPVEEITITVKPTDGTQMSYEWIVGAFRCTKILDRNGNYISMSYDPTSGTLLDVTDTLGRTVSISYDEDLCPLEITQTWKTDNGKGTSGTITHKWAEFSYTTKTVDIDFDSSITSIVGPPDSTVVKVLDKIKYPDESFTGFDYNGYLQVSKVSTIAAETTTRGVNYVSTNLDSPSSDQEECPRFTETRTKTKDFNGDSEVVINNSRTAGQTYSLPGSLSGTGALIKSWTTGHPDDLQTWTYVGESGWKEGLALATEDCLETDCSDPKRWTWTDWEQDIYAVTTPAYMCNPRVKETRVGDGANIRKTTTTYVLYDGVLISYFGLVDESKVYDGSTVLKTQKNSWVTDSHYIERRIVGLPYESKLFQGASSGTLMSKVTYTYDSYDDPTLAGLSGTTHHDAAYGTSFRYRGNLTETKRWDVAAQTTDALAVASHVAYNIAGSPVSQTDPGGRSTLISYADEWNDSSRTTYAYPTTVTDAAGYSSTIQYRFDTGANVWAQSPPPKNQTVGKTTSRTFDDTTGRIVKEKVENTGAYTRYAYATEGNAVTAYTTVIDGTTTTEYVDSEDEVATETIFDGASRVIRTRTENPDSEGGYTAKRIEYDLLGRVTRETVPTEVDSSWQPVGDDDDRGVDNTDHALWLWNSMEYDWKGRVTKTIPSDSDGTDGKDTRISYVGCGCAGGQVTTIKGPVTAAIDVSGTMQTTLRRMQKIHEDALGRTVRTELYNFETGSVYSTTVNTYNARDQITNVAQYAGSTAGSHQDTEMEYDGHGRLSTVHKPEYATSTHMTTTYNVDDTVATVRDPRDAVVAYTYESGSGEPKRPLVTKIEYAASPNPTPPSPPNISVPHDVTFAYDAAGNRISMSDGTGDLTYAYDELSRLTSETKDFDDTLGAAPPGGVYVLSYTYHLNGALKSIEDPFGYMTTYAADKVGRITDIGVAGTAHTADADYYAKTIGYRAFGSIKSLKMGTSNETDVEMTYDNALRPATYLATANSATVQGADYTYNNDGLLKEVSNNADHNFDQKNEYDFAGRLKVNDVRSDYVHPLKQTLVYDAFNNLTTRTNEPYSLTARTFLATFANNRQVSSSGSSFTYDAAGNVTKSDGFDSAMETSFDAAGRKRRWEEIGPVSSATKKAEETAFDGDGRAVKNTVLAKHWTPEDEWQDLTPYIQYFIYSSVTGQKITDVLADGSFVSNHIYLGSTIIAEQTDSSATFKVTDPITGSTRQSPIPMGSEEESRIELAGLNTYVPHIEPGNYPGPQYQNGAYFGNPDNGCVDAYDDPGPCTMRYRLSQYLGVALAPAGNGSGKGSYAASGRSVSMGWGPGIVLPPTDGPTVMADYGVDRESAEFGGDDKVTLTPLSTDQRKTLKNDLKTFTGKKACNDLITGILAALKKTGNAGYDTTDINELFKAILENSDNRMFSANYLEVWDAETTHTGNAPYALTSFGRQGPANAKRTTIRLDSYIMGFSPGNLAGKPFIYSSLEANETLVHELLHAFGRDEYFNHTQMAQHAYVVATGLGMTVKVLPTNPDDMSMYFDDIVKQACK